jgi:hypothetical protein
MMIKLDFPRCFLFGFILLVFFAQELLAFQFKNQLDDRSSKVFEHWNTKQKKVTGYTTVSYLTNEKTGELLEISKNLDDKRIAFSEKKTWFDASGELKKYDESDFRTQVRTINTYSQNEIHTEIWEKDKKTEFKIEIQADLVPFEVLALHLQSKLTELEQTKSIPFTLYLPVLALELSKKGWPLSLSRLGMNAVVEAISSENTVLGNLQTITIRVEPTSFIIQALLPAEKSKFYFTFVRDKLFTLLQFEEGETQTRLTGSH